MSVLVLVIRSRVSASSSVSVSRFRVLSSFFGFGFDLCCYVSFPFALFDSVFVDMFRLGFRCPISLIVRFFIYRCCSSLYSNIVSLSLSFCLFGFVLFSLIYMFSPGYPG